LAELVGVDRVKQTQALGVRFRWRTLFCPVCKSLMVVFRGWFGEKLAMLA
jgi:hypothetical protein